MNEISLNGAPRMLDPGETLDELIRKLGLDPRWVVAEVNGEAVGRERFADRVLAAGDKVELIRAVAGG